MNTETTTAIATEINITADVAHRIDVVTPVSKCADGWTCQVLMGQQVVTATWDGDHDADEVVILLEADGCDPIEVNVHSSAATPAVYATYDVFLLAL